MEWNKIKWKLVVVNLGRWQQYTRVGRIDEDRKSGLSQVSSMMMKVWLNISDTLKEYLCNSGLTGLIVMLNTNYFFVFVTMRTCSNEHFLRYNFQISKKSKRTCKNFFFIIGCTY